MAERHERRLAAILVADMVGYSRLMGADERETIARQKIHLSEIFDPTITGLGGRIVKTTGDGLLVEFASVVDAVEGAVSIQQAIVEREADEPEDRRIRYRIGINLGDIVIDGDDILGDGVNVAARLETIAPPGGICISEMVKNALGQQGGIQFEDLGPKRLKNIAQSVHAYLVIDDGGDNQYTETGYRLSDQSAVRYVLSGDAVSIAYADVGTGYPLVFGGSWMTHLEKIWEFPGWGFFLTQLSKTFRLIRYDQRGNGMSDWDNVDISFEKMVDDLERVIDCYDYEKVAIFGPSQAASVSIAYAIRHPERVSHLVLHGAYARGRRRRGKPEDAAESEALVTLIRQGWATENPAFRQTMTSIFMPDASREEADWFNDFQKTCGPAENIARFREMFDEMDVSDLLDKLQVPTLIIHCSGDTAAPISEGKFLASRIPGAQFIMLNSNNHMIFENEPDSSKFVQSIRDFIK
jgi:class 3 adenylate cyclase/pimeloyl-ACP methyl ester carboxylesterase